MMWPKQVERAKDLGYKCVFWSMQTLASRRAVTRAVNYMSTYKPTLLPKLYNTCRIINEQVNQSEVCWQNIAIYNFTDDFEFPLPGIEIFDYEKKYKSIKTIR